MSEIDWLALKEVDRCSPLSYSISGYDSIELLTGIFSLNCESRKRLVSTACHYEFYSNTINANP